VWVAAGQFLGNCVTANDENQHFVWENWFPRLLLEILHGCKTVRKVYAPILMALYNCIQSDHSEGAKARFRALLEDEPVVRLLVTSAVLGSKDIGVDGSQDLSSLNATDPALEWLSFIFRKMFLSGCLHSVMKLSASKMWKSQRSVDSFQMLEEDNCGLHGNSHDSEDSSMLITPDQLILLNLLHSEIGDMSDAECCCVCFEPSAFSDLSHMILQYKTRMPVNAHEEGQQRRQVWHRLHDEASAECIRIFAHCTGKPTCKSEIKRHFVNNGLLQTMFKFITGCPPPPMDAKVDAMRLVSNLCYRCKDVQDTVRTTDGFFPTILEKCVMDANYPLMREWSLVAVRNLCEENVENQNFVRSLTLQPGQKN